MIYHINKGVGKSFVFKGLTTTYVFVALGGVVLGILSYYMLSFFLPLGLTIFLVVSIVLVSVGGAYYVNNKFGERGLGYYRASLKTYQRIQNNKRVRNLLVK